MTPVIDNIWDFAKISCERENLIKYVPNLDNGRVKRKNSKFSLQKSCFLTRSSARARKVEGLIDDTFFYKGYTANGGVLEMDREAGE